MDAPTNKQNFGDCGGDARSPEGIEISAILWFWYSIYYEMLIIRKK